MMNELARVSPAISMHVRTAGMRDLGLYASHSQSNRSSGTGILATYCLLVIFTVVKIFFITYFWVNGGVWIVGCNGIA
jgi:hypothetical protein